MSVFSYLMHQRGNLILHVVININGNAVAFLGDNGCGKSTSLYALHRTGYPFITDDSLSISFNDKNFPMVTPSFSRLKLCQDIRDYMVDDFDNLQKTYTYSEKYSYSANANFSYEQLPLKKMYIVEKGKKSGLSQLTPKESLMKLIKNSYCYRIFSKNEIAQNLIDCSKIVNNVSIKHLKIYIL